MRGKAQFPFHVSLRTISTSGVRIKIKRNQSVIKHLTRPPVSSMSLQLQAFRLVLKPQGRHFQGYNSNVNPTIPNAAAAAALRFGHSTIRNDFSRFGRDHERLLSIDLREFHNPEFLYEVDNGGVDGILRGMSKDSAQNIDRCVGLFVASQTIARS